MVKNMLLKIKELFLIINQGEIIIKMGKNISKKTVQGTISKPIVIIKKTIRICKNGKNSMLNKISLKTDSTNINMTIKTKICTQTLIPNIPYVTLSIAMSNMAYLKHLNENTKEIK